MAHNDTEELQKLAHSLARKVRQQPGTTDEMYQLLSIFHARLKVLEEQQARNEAKLNQHSKDIFMGGARY